MISRTSCRGSSPLSWSTVPHVPGQVRRRQLASGEVDRHPQGSTERRRPAGHLGRGLDERPATQADDVSGLLGHRHEDGRGDRAQDRVVPPGQCLEADHLLGAEVDDRLVVQGELAALEGAAEPVGHLVALGEPGAHRRVEDLDPVASRGLRLVHGGVRLADELVGAHPGPGHGQTGAHRDPRSAAIPAEVGLQRVDDPLGDLEGGRDVVDVRHQDGELVAAHPGHGVDRAHVRRDDVGDPPQDAVAHVVTERVVDLLEPVEVAEAHGHGASVGRQPDSSASARPLQQQAAVGEAGELVVEGQMAQLGLEEVALGVRRLEFAGRGARGRRPGRPCGGASTACGRRSG